MADGLFFSQPSSHLLSTLTTCPFLDLDLVLNKIDLISHHHELLKYISLLHQNNRTYRAIIIAEKLLSSGLFVPEKDYEFIMTAQRTGHILGFNKPISLTINHEKKIFMTEGAVNHQSLTFLVEKLNAYLDYMPKKSTSKKEYAAFELLAKTLNKTIQKIYPHTHLYKPGSAEWFYQEYLDNQLIILTSGWKGHTVGLALLNGALVVCNRGPGTIPGKGTNIYPILHPESITEQWFKDIIDLDNKKNIQDFNSMLSKIIDLNSPKITFPSRPQKNGNCSYANLKSLLEGVLYLLLRLDKETALDQKTAIEIKNRKKYKNFTYFSRAHELFFILTKIYSPEKSELKLAFYNELLNRYFIKKNYPTKYGLETQIKTLHKHSVIQQLIHKHNIQTEYFSELKKKPLL